MKKISLILVMSLLLCLNVSIATADDVIPAQATDITAIAKALVTNLEKGDYAKARENFDATMQTQATEAVLKNLWESIITQYGAFAEQTSFNTGNTQGYTFVNVICKFEKNSLGIRVIFNENSQIAGLSPVPVTNGIDPTPSANSDTLPATVIEKTVTVGSGQWALPGTLTLPKGVGPFPVVVLVHGSGANDRDETIGPNKPFRDIAWGLATKGIAVLRYEKRTKQYGKQMAGDMNITVKEETIDDALAAVTLLRKTGKVDKNRIYVLGHSLGGMLIPRIGSLDKNIKGLISLAGPSRPMEDIILEQYEYLLSIDKTATDKTKKDTLDKLKAQIKMIKDPKLSTATTKSLILNAPVKYWLDLRGYNPPQLAKTLKQPMLFLQGARDYQVSLKDLNLWKTGLSSKKNASFITYPDLNHLFITGNGKSTPAEYNNPGHVSNTVITDISNWIKIN
jgi:uncharacterized protein